MNQTEIRQFDVLVHPDYHLQSPTNVLTPRHSERRLGWDQRAAQLESNPNAVMLYFSTFATRAVDSDQIVMVGSSELTQADADRIESYQQLLGDRFFLFTHGQRPEKAELMRMFEERDFIYNPKKAKLFAYGELLNACVSIWRKHITTELQLRGRNSQPLKELSYRSMANDQEVEESSKLSSLLGYLNRLLQINRPKFS